MTSFPLAATGAYAAIRPPEPPPVQSAPQGPPPMTSFPLAATGAYQAVGRQHGDPDLSASGFRAVPGSAPNAPFNGPSAPPAMPGPYVQPGMPGPQGPPPPANNRRRTLLIGGAVVAVVGVAAGAIALATGGDGKKPSATPPSTTPSSAPLTTASSSPSTQAASTSAQSTPTPSPPAATPPAHATPPVADVLFWKLSDKPGSTSAADATGKKHSGALSGKVGFSTAHGGSAEFKGVANASTGGQIKTAGPVIDTTKSFTVSMWVDQTGTTTPTKYAAAFSQDGAQCFAFTFSYSLDSKKWSFVRADADGATPKTVNAVATAPTPMNTWVHLTGVYDAQAGTIAFYVNGAPQGAPMKTGSAPYAATGPFAIGRSWYGKGPTNPFEGYIDGVQVFSRALTAAEVAVL